MEDEIPKSGKSLATASQKEMNMFWEAAKKQVG